MFPPAPARLSMMICWPRGSVSFCPSSLPMISTGPPGANGAMKRTGLLGQACPEPVEVACALQSPASVHAAQNARARMVIPMRISFSGAESYHRRSTVNSQCDKVAPRRFPDRRHYQGSAMPGRKLNRQDLRDAAEKYKNWGKWGPNDEIGTLNHTRPEDIVAAATMSSGRVWFSVPISSLGPHLPQFLYFSAASRRSCLLSLRPGIALPW